MREYPFVSVIIPAFNSERTIRQCLESLINLNYPDDKYEIIVADHGSEDSTIDIVKSLNIDARSFPAAKSIAALRNEASKLAKGDILAFIDSDCIAYPDWLTKAIDFMTEHKSDVAGSEYLIRDDPTWVEKTWFDLRAHSSIREVNVIPGCNFIIKKNIFVEIDGFDDEFVTGEDTDICHRLKSAGYQVTADNKIRVIHLNEPRSLKQLFLKQIWYGREMFKLIKRHPNFNAAKVSIISYFYLLAFMSLVILLLFRQFIIFIIILLSFFIIIPFMFSLIKRIQGKRASLYKSAIIYFVYFSARAFSLIYYNMDIIRNKFMHRESTY